MFDEMSQVDTACFILLRGENSLRTHVTVRIYYGATLLP